MKRRIFLYNTVAVLLALTYIYWGPLRRAGPAGGPAPAQPPPGS